MLWLSMEKPEDEIPYHAYPVENIRNLSKNSCTAKMVPTKCHIVHKYAVMGWLVVVNSLRLGYVTVVLSKL